MAISEKARLANAQNSLLAGQKMTVEQKKERARAGGNAAGSNMTPEQRSERARNAALARYAGKNKAQEG